MALSFASAEDAIRFCEKNRWEYEVLQPQERKVGDHCSLHLMRFAQCMTSKYFFNFQIKSKSYGENFHWSKSTRVGTK